VRLVFRSVRPEKTVEVVCAPLQSGVALRVVHAVQRSADRAGPSFAKVSTFAKAMVDASEGRRANCLLETYSDVCAARLPRFDRLRIIVVRAEGVFLDIFRRYRRCADSTSGYCLASLQDVFVCLS
jgi:hypothetical protein